MTNLKWCFDLNSAANFRPDPLLYLHCSLGRWPVKHSFCPLCILGLIFCWNLVPSAVRLRMVLTIFGTQKEMWETGLGGVIFEIFSWSCGTKLWCTIGQSCPKIALHRRSGRSGCVWRVPQSRSPNGHVVGPCRRQVSMRCLGQADERGYSVEKTPGAEETPGTG